MPAINDFMKTNFPRLFEALQRAVKDSDNGTQIYEFNARNPEECSFRLVAYRVGAPGEYMIGVFFSNQNGLEFYGTHRTTLQDELKKFLNGKGCQLKQMYREPDGVMMAVLPKS